VTYIAGSAAHECGRCRLSQPTSFTFHERLVFFGQHAIFVSNRRLTTLVEFVLSTANDQATTEEARAFVDRFDKLQADTFFPGIDIDLLFTSPSERRFWASAFAELAKRIEHRRIGNPDQHDWRQEAADQATQIARMLVSNQDEG
jgi:hypothetical protein